MRVPFKIKCNAGLQDFDLSSLESAEIVLPNGNVFQITVQLDRPGGVHMVEVTKQAARLMCEPMAMQPRASNVVRLS